MASQALIEEERLEADRRFGALRSYIVASSQRFDPSGQGFRIHLYTGWVLLCYATVESALRSGLRAALQQIGTQAATPGHLPSDVRRRFQERLIKELLAEIDSSDDARFFDMVTALSAESWTDHIDALNIDGNVWPDRVQAAARRIGVRQEAFEWYRQSAQDGSETLESRLRALVAERNSLAHGDLPVATLSADLMTAWVRDVANFSRHFFGTLQAHAIDTYPNLAAAPVGTVDKQVEGLSDSTVAFSSIDCTMMVGDHAILVYDDGRPATYRQVKSMQSEGVSLELAGAGSERISVTFSGSVRQGSLVQAI